MQTPVNITLYFYSLKKAGGAERILTSLANALSKRGYIVHVISWDIASTSSFFPLEESITWHQLGFGMGLVNKVRRTFRLFKTLRKNSINVFIGFVMSGDKTVFAAVKAAGIPLVVAERNAPSMYEHRYSKFQRWQGFSLLRLANIITVQFPGFINGYPTYLRKKIKVIPNPVENPKSQATSSKRGKNGHFTLLAVSRLDEIQKQLSCLLKAFALIKDKFPTWDLRIIGEGPDKVSLVSLAENLDLGGQVIFEQPGTHVFEAYLESHLFVMPSLWEGFPNALAEAMAHGLPAVGFEQAEGVADLIKDGETGWLAEGLDDELTLSQALSSAMEDEEERVFRGANGMNHIKRYSPEGQIDRWEKIIHLLIPRY